MQVKKLTHNKWMDTAITFVRKGDYVEINGKTYLVTESPQQLQPPIPEDAWVSPSGQAWDLKMERILFDEIPQNIRA